MFLYPEILLRLSKNLNFPAKLELANYFLFSPACMLMRTAWRRTRSRLSPTYWSGGSAFWFFLLSWTCPSGWNCSQSPLARSTPPPWGWRTGGVSVKRHEESGCLHPVPWWPGSWRQVSEGLLPLPLVANTMPSSRWRRGWLHRSGLPLQAGSVPVARVLTNLVRAPRASAPIPSLQPLLGAPPSDQRGWGPNQTRRTRWHTPPPRGV